MEILNWASERKRKTFFIAIIAVTALLYALNIKFNQRKIYIDTYSDKETKCTEILANGYSVEQNLYIDHDLEIAVQLCMITWETVFDKNDCLTISIIDHESDQIICQKEYKAGSFADHQLSNFILFEGITFESGHWYGIRIESNITDESKPIAVACSENTIPDIANVTEGGKSADHNLRLKIFEKPIEEKR